jgi:nucleotide-binding universal stress UspA family protein
MKKYAFPPNRILIPTDLTATSLPAFQIARVLHEQFGGAVHVMHAQHFDLPPYFSSGQIQNLKRELKQSLKAATEYLRKESQAVLGFAAEVSVVEKPPVEAILDASEAAGTDLIVMGTHGRHGAGRLWIGSVAERIVHASPIPILTVRQGVAAASLGHILCPVNLAASSRAALQYAVQIAEAGKLRLTVIHALEDGDKPLDCSLVPDEVRRNCRVDELTYHGDAASVILNAVAELKPDLIVMGAEKRLSAFGELFSSTTERVMQWAHAPLLVVPKSGDYES